MVRAVYTRIRFLYKEHEEHGGSDSDFCNKGMEQGHSLAWLFSSVHLCACCAIERACIG